MNRNRIGENVTIKARFTNHGETIARKVIVDRSIKLDELEFKLRERFDVSYDKVITLYYVDDDKDRVAISFEDELSLALENSKIPVFEIIIKPRSVDHEFTYPRIQKGNPGECVEVLVESQFLTLANAKRDDTKAWGTHVYTDDSDIVKILGHSEKIDLPDVPPPYNVIVTIRFIPGCLKYIGSTSHGITTMNYGPYDLSFIIEDVRTVPIIDEKPFY